MMNSQAATHTIRSHGLAVSKFHMHDWLIIALLAAITGLLGLMHPFHRFVGKDMMADLKYPLKPSTIPFWTVPLYAVFLPIVIFLGFYLRRKDVYDLHHAVLGLLFSVFITGVITEALKGAIGRPRPDFFGGVFQTEKMCTINGEKFNVMGIAMLWSFAGLGFLSLYLSGKIRAFDRQGHAAKLCIVFLPLLVASLVAITRVDNYRHHWQDVFVGGLIGITIAIFCYLQFFAPPYHAKGWGPYAFFRALEGSYANTNNDVGEVEFHQHERNNDLATVSSDQDSHMSVDDPESGRH